ncbi:hypothetical protein [Nannocystis sp. SCPEA4]|uniref:hypothetical protein n=1 Tax=Nannocystis sp. SCPEA4 TaxID=2996787 RepID=UPI002270B011|nr:hypothetical protein [Nannocystis sp. SCPEA4]MCY1059343.1 hypothetical protein [Nannocystis sp. SCPEA4]
MDELVPSSVVSPVLVLVAVASVLVDVTGAVLSVPGSAVEVEVGTAVSAVDVDSVPALASVGSLPEVSPTVLPDSVVEDAVVLVSWESSPQAAAAISTAQRRES